ncbi:MAG TPA: hypothetical protein VGJ95_09750 [Pseudonocardiaceae bacterium]
MLGDSDTIYLVGNSLGPTALASRERLHALIDEMGQPAGRRLDD